MSAITAFAIGATGLAAIGHLILAFCGSPAPCFGEWLSPAPAVKGFTVAWLPYNELTSLVTRLNPLRADPERPVSR